MNKLVTVGFLLLATTLVDAAPGDAPSPVFNLRVKGENEELAEGYAKAFSSLRSVPFHVRLSREDGESLVIPDIKRVTASGAVLVLETGKGLIYVVRPKDIMWFSDAPPEKTASGKR